MKAKYIGILSLALLSIFGCDDNTGTLGMGMLPDSDGLSAHTASFDVTTYSVEAEQVFLKQAPDISADSQTPISDIMNPAS